MRFSYVIIDNNRERIRATQSALQYAHEFTCLGIENRESQGLDLILKFCPTLVFLNLDLRTNLSQKTGLSIIKELRGFVNKMPSFVVFSESNTFAIEAIRNDVLDYIIEPVNENVIRRLIFRFKKSQQLEFERTSAMDSVLCLKSYGDYKFVNTNDVLYLKADNNTTDIKRMNGTTVSAFKNLKYFQNLLPDHFIRVHNSYIVNSHHISRIHFGKSQCTTKHTNDAVPFSKSYRENVEMIRDSLSQSSLFIA